jgi:hypothetical protein
MISRTLADLVAPTGPAPVAAPLPFGSSSTPTDPRAAALAAAARLGIKIPIPGAAPVQASGQMQSLPAPGAAGAGMQQPGYVSSSTGLNAPGAAPQPMQMPQGNPNTQQMTPQRQALLDALRARMGGLGQGNQMGANQAALSAAQKAALAARNMVDDRGVFAGQQTGAAIPTMPPGPR